MTDAYNQTGRDGFTAAQRNFAKTLPEEAKENFDGMTRAERDAVISGTERPHTPNGERKPTEGTLEARVAALERGDHLRAGKDIDIQGTRISLKSRQDRGSGDGSASNISGTVRMTVLEGGVITPYLFAAQPTT